MSVPSTPPTYAELAASNEEKDKRIASLESDVTMAIDALKEIATGAAYTFTAIEGEPVDQPVPYTPVTPISRKGA